VPPDYQDETLSYLQFGDLPTGIGPNAWCPNMDTPDFYSYPEARPVFQHVTVVPAEGVVERAILADFLDCPHRSWAQAFAALWAIMVITLTVICFIFWTASA
jgi:hypothetical protein